MRSPGRASAPSARKTNASALAFNHAAAARCALLDVSPRLISQKEFLRFQTLIYREAGIWLSEVKTALLTGRLSRRLRALKLDNFSQYYDRVTMDEEERRTMLDAITTNETHFFREPAHFQFLEQRVFPAWQTAAASGHRSRTIRVWSAGCSTGQEPYSLAMMLVDRFPADQGWSIEIVATDLSRRALAIAEEGIWDASKAHEIPPHYLRAYMLRGIGGSRGRMKAAPDIRVVRFLRLNLNDAEYPALGKFDLIFCRNVLIYFDLESRKRVLERLIGHLAPEARLFVGHAESLNSVCPALHCIIPTVYRQAERPSEVKHAPRA